MEAPLDCGRLAAVEFDGAFFDIPRVAGCVRPRTQGGSRRKAGRCCLAANANRAHVWPSRGAAGRYDRARQCRRRLRARVQLLLPSAGRDSAARSIRARAARRRQVQRRTTSARDGAHRGEPEPHRAFIPEQHIRAGIPCALLEDGVCSVYEARPASCRKYYSVSVDTCCNAYNDTSTPLTGEIEHEQVRLAGNAVALGHAKGLEDAGYDAALCELHHALHRALTDPKAEKRYRHRKRAFV